MAGWLLWYCPSHFTLRWRHNGRDSVSNHQPHHCLLNRLFRRRSKKTSKRRVTGLCAWNSPGTGEFPAQKASNAENVSIGWRHHEFIRHLPVNNDSIYTMPLMYTHIWVNFCKIEQANLLKKYLTNYKRIGCWEFKPQNVTKWVSLFIEIYFSLVLNHWVWKTMYMITITFKPKMSKFVDGKTYWK